MNHLPFIKYGLLKHAFLFKSGGRAGGAGGAPGATVMSSAPPPTTQSVEVQQAQRDARKQAAKRKGLSQTILAGETGGVQPLGGTGQQKPTVLGGV